MLLIAGPFLVGYLGLAPYLLNVEQNDFKKVFRAKTSS